MPAPGLLADSLDLGANYTLDPEPSVKLHLHILIRDTYTQTY